jgi:hypothetical protein
MNVIRRMKMRNLSVFHVNNIFLQSHIPRNKKRLPNRIIGKNRIKENACRFFPWIGLFQNLSSYWNYERMAI